MGVTVIFEHVMQLFSCDVLKISNFLAVEVAIHFEFTSCQAGSAVAWERGCMCKDPKKSVCFFLYKVYVRDIV